MRAALSAPRARMLRKTLVLGIPVAALVVFLSVRNEPDRALADAVLGLAWTLTLLSAIRARVAVLAASCVVALGTVPWALVAWLAATPCQLSGRGLLTPIEPQCPVQAAHVLAALAGGACTAALIVAFAGGFSYASGRDERRLRLFGNCLLAAAALVLLWLPTITVLPRNHVVD